MLNGRLFLLRFEHCCGFVALFRIKSFPASEDKQRKALQTPRIITLKLTVLCFHTFT